MNSTNFSPERAGNIVYLRTLGRPALLGADGYPVRLRKKDLALLVYLCMEGPTVHSRLSLASLLWAESPENSARHTLTQALGRVRHALPPGSLVVGKEAVGLAGTLKCDAVELLRGGLAPADVDDGFSHYADHFLEGFDPGPGAEAFRAWADGQRPIIQQAALRLLDRAASEAVEAGNRTRAVHLGKRALQVERIRTMYLRTLGYPILFADDGSPVEGLGTKDLALLIYLCVEDAPVHSREHLAALLWREYTKKKALHSLGQTLRRLRKALPAGMMALNKNAVRWEGGLQCDAVTLWGGIDRTPVDDAFSLYRGDFLAGFEAGNGAENFAEWADRRRPMLRQAALRVLADAGDSAVARADWRRAIHLAERAVEIDPVWEDGHRRLMQALAASGERNRALQHYKEFEAWLAVNVDSEPDPDTRALAEKLRASPWKLQALFTRI